MRAWTVLGMLVLAGLCALPAGAEDTAPESPAGLLERAFANLYGDDFVQVLELATRRREGQPMLRRIQLVRKQRERPGRTMVRFLAPPDVRRTGVLILEAEGRYDDLFVFLPALGKVRRLAAAQRADSFFGTDLAYEDVEPKRAADWQVELVEQSAEHGVPCALLEIRPRRPDVSTYERMVSCIDAERAIILRTDFWRGGQEVKQLRVRPEDVREISGRRIPFVMTLSTPRLRSETVVTTLSYELRESLPASIFTQMNLESGDAAGDRRSGSGS